MIFTPTAFCGQGTGVHTAMVALNSYPGKHFSHFPSLLSEHVTVEAQPGIEEHRGQASVAVHFPQHECIRPAT